jgi:hypothetical protein
MGKLHIVPRKGDGTITIEVMEEGQIINGKYVPKGNIKVVKGLRGETYWIKPDIFKDGYEITPEIEFEIKRANAKY